VSARVAQAGALALLGPAAADPPSRAPLFPTRRLPRAANGYTIRHAYIAQPLWVSAPAVLYDGNQLAYLVFAVTLPSSDGRGRVGS